MLGESLLLADGLPDAAAIEAVQQGRLWTLISRTVAVDAGTPQTVRRAPWQFSLRSLLLFTTALAGMLSTMKMLGIVVCPSTVLLFLALLLPVWLPLIFFAAESRRQRLRPLLALVPAGWYVLLVGGYSGWPFQQHLLVLLAFGYSLAAVALAFSVRGRRQLINVPLWLALLASACALL